MVKSAAGSPILEAGQALIAGMRLTTGWGDPERGDPFGEGTARFTGAGETAASAFPGEDWQGFGAQAYATANRRQAGHIESIATLDRRAQTVIAREAYQVAYHRDKLDDQSNYLGDLSYVTWSIALIPGAGKAMQFVVELGAVQAAMSICGAELSWLSQETGVNAEELGRLAGEYAGLSRPAPPPDLDDADPQPPEPDAPAGAGPPDQNEPERPTQIVIPGSLPTTPQLDASCAGAAASVSPAYPVIEAPVGAAIRPAESGTAAAPPAEMMSGMASAFGAAGAMIGSVAAALTGAAGAAGQSLSKPTSADVGAFSDDGSEPAIEEAPPETESEDEHGPPDSAAGAGGGSGPAPPDVVGESADLQPQSRTAPEPVRPAVPPAQTRPPR